MGLDKKSLKLFNDRKHYIINITIPVIPPKFTFFYV